MCGGIYLVLNSNTLSVGALSRLAYTQVGGHVTVSRSDYFSKSHYLVQTTLVSSSKSISFVWGLYLVHQRILMIDKQANRVCRFDY